jgi:hypothetical protein
MNTTGSVAAVDVPPVATTATATAGSSGTAGKAAAAPPPPPPCAVSGSNALAALVSYSIGEDVFAALVW